MLPEPAEIVARYLRANGYDETLAAFLKEAGLPPDAGSDISDKVTVENILQEKRAFDLSLNFEKLRVEEESEGWSAASPEHAEIVNALPTSSNILCAFIGPIEIAERGSQPLLVTTTAHRQLNLITTHPNRSLLRSYAGLHNSPILCSMILRKNYLLTATMAGTLSILDTVENNILVSRQDHKKHIVRIAKCEVQGGVYIATAGWDGHVHVYFLAYDQENCPSLGNPIGTLELPSNPEGVVFLIHPESKRPILLLTRQDSTFLYYFSVPTVSPLSQLGKPTMDLQAIGRQNLSPQSSSWVAFTPSYVAISPKDPSIAAIATSTTPHMKLLVVRLLIPLDATQSPEVAAPAPSTQASQSRVELALQKREEAAILLSCNTFAPQTVYSTPIVVWRPDANGLWVSGDDGVIRGINVNTGEVITKLLGHTPGSKVRSLWAGLVTVERETELCEEEWLVSGGFDQKLIIWRPS